MVDETMVRHPREAFEIQRAIVGGPDEIDLILDDLCSANSQRCKVLQDAIRDLNDPLIWNYMLKYLAFYCWHENDDSFLQPKTSAKKVVGQAIIEVFIRDEWDCESEVKVDVLYKNLDSPQLKIRYSAAYLLGLRGDPASIPILSRIIDVENKTWKLRSVEALSKINNEDCAVPLMKALIIDRGKIHREARRALRNLGPYAESVWSKALNHTDSHIRWEAAHGLSQIGDSRAALTLAEGLLDENYVVRWTTANVLAQIGEDGVRSVFNILVKNELNETLRQSALHTLNRITSPELREKIKPLMDALLRSSSNELPSSIARGLLMEWED